LEKEVRGIGFIRTPEAQAAGRGKSAIKTDGGGFEFGQAHVTGGIVKKVLRPVRKRKLVDVLQDSYQVSERRACKVLGLNRSTQRYKGQRDEQAELRMRIKEIAAVRVRYGYKRIHVLLRREGWRVNHKRVYRIYCEEGLNIRAKRPKRRVSAAHRVAKEKAVAINDSWSMDFVSDNLFNGRRFRALTIVDNFSRECPAIFVDRGITGEQVVESLNRLKFTRGLPKTIQVDNGPEFISKALDKWAYEHGITLWFSRPGKPQDNALVESFNGSFRDECLNVNWFLSLEDARKKIETWRLEYNNWRPHSSLDNLTPNDFAKSKVQKETKNMMPNAA